MKDHRMKILPNHLLLTLMNADNPDAYSGPAVTEVAAATGGGAAAAAKAPEPEPEPEEEEEDMGFDLFD